MTLEGMNAYLRDKGFDVHRERDSKRNLYIFTIRKPGYEAFTKEFKYPKSDDYNYRHEQMEKFLEGMVRDFYKGEEKEMSYITWHVEEYEVHKPSATTLPNIEVSLTGVIDNYGAYKSRNLREVMEELTEKLNQNDHPRVTYEDYCRADIESTKRTYQYVSKTPHFGRLPEITNVIFNDPATIVFWADGTKTVVKVQEGYYFDPMSGLSMAICEKAFGSKANSHKVFNKWLPKEDEPILYPRVKVNPFNLRGFVSKVNWKEEFDKWLEEKHI